MRAVPLVLAVIVAVAISVLRTRDQEDDRRRVVATDQTAELLRITDPAQAAGELRSLILQNLKLSGPYIALTMHDTDVQVIPASTPWTVRCDGFAGISIAFTANVTDTSGGLVMQLSEARPNKTQCIEIGLASAKALGAILAGQ
jgi:hypothetical protein